MFCTYCNKPIIGEPPYSGYEGEVVSFDGKQANVLAPGRGVAFCGSTCCWRYGVEAHRDFGMTGKEIRRHLVEVHHLTPPVKA